MLAKHSFGRWRNIAIILTEPYERPHHPSQTPARHSWVSHL